MYINNVIAFNNKIVKFDYLSRDEFKSYDSEDEGTLNTLRKAYNEKGIEGLVELKRKYKKYSKLFQFINNQVAEKIGDKI